MRWKAFSLIVFGLVLPACASPVLAVVAPVTLSVGSPAPAFVRPGLDGKPVALNAYRGKLVLLDFWASWCPPCIIAIPELIGLQKKYRGKLQIIGVSMDDDPASAKDVASRNPFNYPLLMGDVQLGRLYGGILGLPAGFLISPDGKVVKVLRGELNPGELDRTVQTAVER